MDGETHPKRFAKPRAEGEILYVEGLLYDPVLSVSEPVLHDNALDLLARYCQEHKSTPFYAPGIPRFQALLRVLIQDSNLEIPGPLLPSAGALQRHASAFLDWLALREDGALKYRDYTRCLEELGLQALLDEGGRDITLRSLILRDADDGEDGADVLSTHETLHPGQKLRGNIVAKMALLESNCLFQTDRGYLGLGPKAMRSGDSIAVLFGCRNPVVLRPVGSYHRHLGPCFILGLMEGEAIRELLMGLQVAREFQII
jgi:hypothetical protein